MAWNHLSKNRANGRLNALITFYAARVDHLPEVKLDKLIYIAHLYHCANVGELLTPTRFFSLAFGPHAPAIRTAVKDLLETHVISMATSRTSSDPIYSNPCRIIKAGAPMAEDLSSSHLSSLHEVLETWGNQPYERILDFTARTLPYLSTAYREPIDWPVSPHHQELKYVLPMAQRTAIHQFVEKPEASFEESAGRSQKDPLSIHEVAEIYLALSDGRPETLPVREHLGFDLQSAHHALARPGQKEKWGPEAVSTALDEAAQMTDALFSGLCFKNLSARVALTAGMLFLKKRDYTFDSDVLEKKWPKGHSCQFLKEWFSTVSVKVDTVSKSRLEGDEPSDGHRLGFQRLEAVRKHRQLPRTKGVCEMNKIVLAIDDELDTLTFYSEVLEDYHYTPLTAANGVEGLKIAREKKPDLILLDIMMPMKDGTKTYKELKNDPDLKDIPVIIITGISKEVDYKKLLDRPSTGKIPPESHLVKPITAEELIDTIKAVLP